MIYVKHNILIVNSMHETMLQCFLTGLDLLHLDIAAAQHGQHLKSYGRPLLHFVSKSAYL